MDDIQLYIYLALGLIYFLVRAFKSKKPEQGGQDLPEAWPGDEKKQRPPRRDPSVSFEDLLKEFTGYREEQKPVREVETVEEEEEPVEEREYKSYEGYDDYKKGTYVDYDDLVVQSGKLKTIDEQVQIEDTVREYAAGYEIVDNESVRAHRFREMLMDRDSLKDAFVLKEILEPKHF